MKRFVAAGDGFVAIEVEIVKLLAKIDAPVIFVGEGSEYMLNVIKYERWYEDAVKFHQDSQNKQAQT